MSIAGFSVVRGGQTALHRIRMAAQVLWVTFRVALVLCLVVFVATLYRDTTGPEWGAAWRHVWASYLVDTDRPESTVGVTLADGTSRQVAAIQIVRLAGAARARDRVEAAALRGLGRGAAAGGGLMAVALVAFQFLGGRMKRRQKVRGMSIVSAARLRRTVARGRSLFASPPYTVAGIPFPARAEFQHTLISGTTGSGKTVIISDLVEQIRERGERAIVYDKMGTYTRSFFREDAGDALLNPLDARSRGWSPFGEVGSEQDFAMMAEALIPEQRDSIDPFWITAARQLFAHGAAASWKKGIVRNRDLVDRLLKTDLGELAKVMEGTVAQSVIDPENPRTALSVRAVLTAHIGAMQQLTDGGRPFSIRRWIGGREDGRCLFLTSRGDKHASLRGLISCWLEIAINSLLSTRSGSGQRIWLILDELPTLHKVPSLQSALAESRQFGGCCVLGVQVFSGLRDTYGRNAAETVSGLCNTRVVLASPDNDTAQWSAASLGRGEVKEVEEGVSYGAAAVRDGVMLNQRRELRQLVLPSQIMSLPNLEGYIKFPGGHPIARIAVKWRERPEIAPHFVERQDGAGPSPCGPSLEKKHGPPALEKGAANGPGAGGEAHPGPRLARGPDAGAPAKRKNSGAPKAAPQKPSGPQLEFRLPDGEPAPGGPDSGNGGGAAPAGKGERASLEKQPANGAKQAGSASDGGGEAAPERAVGPRLELDSGKSAAAPAAGPKAKGERKMPKKQPGAGKARKASDRGGGAERAKGAAQKRPASEEPPPPSQGKDGGAEGAPGKGARREAENIVEKQKYKVSGVSTPPCGR